MRLSDRIDRALSRNGLPTIPTPAPNLEESTIVYKNLKEAKFVDHTVDEDGIGCVVVESIDNIKLPMKIGGFTIQDIQKRNDGLYTVQFIEE